MPTRSSKRLDPSQLAKAIVDEATGDAPKEEPLPAKNQAAVELGRLGGKKGGLARAERLSPAQRAELAKNAANARWSRRATKGPAEGESTLRPKAKVKL